MAEGASQRPDRFSYYYLTLDKIPQARYREKLAMLGDIEDPYFTLDTCCSSEQGIEWQNWPNVLYPDIYNYFIETPSEYTKQELKAYKSLDGYKYFVDDWVSDILVLPLSSRRRWSLHENFKTVYYNDTFTELSLKIHWHGPIELFSIRPLDKWSKSFIHYIYPLTKSPGNI